MLVGVHHGALQRLSPRLVALYDRQVPVPGPAAIPVHDDGDVPLVERERDRPPRRRRTYNLRPDGF